MTGKFIALDKRQILRQNLSDIFLCQLVIYNSVDFFIVLRDGGSHVFGFSLVVCVFCNFCQIAYRISITELINNISNLLQRKALSEILLQKWLDFPLKGDCFGRHYYGIWQP